MVNASIKHDFFKRKLSATFQMRDVFNTMKHSFTANTDNIYSYSEFEMVYPVFSFGLSYKLNNYKKKRSKSNDNGDIKVSDDY